MNSSIPVSLIKTIKVAKFHNSSFKIAINFVFSFGGRVELLDS